MYNVEVVNKLNTTMIWNDTLFTVNEFLHHEIYLFVLNRIYNRNVFQIMFNIINDLNQQLKDQHVSN